MANLGSLVSEISPVVWATPANFNGFCTALVVGVKPNCAALNKGCHLYLSGWPSRWALAHILVWNASFELDILERVNDILALMRRMHRGKRLGTAAVNVVLHLLWTGRRWRRRLWVLQVWTTRSLCSWLRGRWAGRRSWQLRLRPQVTLEFCSCFAFGSLTLLVGHQEERKSIFGQGGTLKSLRHSFTCK